MKKTKEIKQVELTKICIQTLPLQISFPDQLEGLKESLKRFGLLSPLIIVPLADIKSAPKNYGLVCGYRRFTALQALGYKKVDALILEGEIAPKENRLENLEEEQLLDIWLTDNQQRQFNPIEMGNLFVRFFHLKLTVTQIADKLRQMDGLRPIGKLSPEMQERYLWINSLTGGQKEKIVSQQINENRLWPLRLFDTQERDFLFDLLCRFNFNANTFKQVCRNLFDLKKIERRNVDIIIKDILSTQPINEKLNRRQRQEKIVQAILLRRSPILPARKAILNKMIKHLSFPKNIRLLFPSNMEGEKLCLQLEIKNEKDFSQGLKILQQLDEEGGLAEIIKEYNRVETAID